MVAGTPATQVPVLGGVVVGGVVVPVGGVVVPVGGVVVPVGGVVVPVGGVVVPVGGVVVPVGGVVVPVGLGWAIAPSGESISELHAASAAVRAPRATSNRLSFMSHDLLRGTEGTRSPTMRTTYAPTGATYCLLAPDFGEGFVFSPRRLEFWIPAANAAFLRERVG